MTSCIFLPIALLFHCIHMSLTNDQPCFHIVPIAMSDNKHTMHKDKKHYASLTDKAGLPDWAQATAHISPRLALMALAAHPNDPSAPREVINGLINTICFQQEAATDDIAMLHTALQAQEALVQELTQCLAKAEGAVDLD